VPICDASVSSLNWWFGSGLTSTGVLVIRVMSFSCAFLCSWPYLNGTFFPVSLVSGAAIMEKFAQNMWW